MADLFTTVTSNESANQEWLANLKATRPDAYQAWYNYVRLKQLDDLSKTSDEGGSATRAARARQRQQLLAENPQLRGLTLSQAQQTLTQKYPDVVAYTTEHGQRTGGLGQGGDELVAAVALPVAAAYMAPAAGAGTAGTTGTTVGTTTGTTVGTTETAITAEEAAQAAGTVGSVSGTGGGGGGGGGGGNQPLPEGGMTNTGTVPPLPANNTTTQSGGYWDSLGNWVSSETGQGLLNLGAGYLQNEQNQQAANTYAQAQLEAARLAAEEARFRPVGVTTRFGQSQFGYDDKGRLTSAGYTLSPELKAQQDALMGAITGNRPQGMLQPQNANQTPSWTSKPQYSIAGARANGGPVAGGQTYLVGENGPELFTAPTSGGIIPNQVGNSIANQGMMYAGGTPSFYGNQSNYSAMSGFNQPSSGVAYAGGSPGFSSGVPSQASGTSSQVSAVNPSFSGVGQTNRPVPGQPLGANTNQFGGQPPAYQPPPVTGVGQSGMVSAPSSGQVGNTSQFGDIGRSPNDSAWQPAAPIQEGGLLGQAVGAQQTTAPMSQGAQSLFNLGQGYLASTPQEQAARYMQEQQALLSPSRDRGLAQLQNQMYQQGRTGLAVGATDTMGAANPELEAFYNAQRQQDLALAAQATQGGQQYAQFGAGLLGTGGEMLRGMYGTQTAAYQPYQTALGLTQNLEGMGQNAMDIGINLGARGAASGAQAGQFLQTGASNAAEAQLPANQYNPWVGLLQGAASWY